MRLVRLACHAVACLPISAAAAPASCTGTLLPNGLCIPVAGPQGARRSAPPVEPTLPPYLSAACHQLLKGLLTKDPGTRLGVTPNCAAFTSDFPALQTHAFLKRA